MIPEAEAETGVKVSEEDKGDHDPSITRIGRILRQTHLDEIPQLWAILVGEINVVSLRPEPQDLYSDIEGGVSKWRRRWFVKLGLTGLAQINGAIGYDPEEASIRHRVYLQAVVLVGPDVCRTAGVARSRHMLAVTEDEA